MARTKKVNVENSNEIQVFEEFTNDEVRVISNYSEKKFYQRGEVVFKENSEDKSLYVVLKGELSVFAHTKDNKKVQLSKIVTGEVFGELSFLDGKPRSATILASDDVDLLQISREQFDLLRNNYPSIASKLILDLARVVSLRLRNADKFIVDISNLLSNQQSESEEKSETKKVKVAKADKKAEVKETKKVKVAKADKKAEVKETKKVKVAKADKKAEVKETKKVKVAKADKKAEVKETKKVKVAKADKKAEVKETKKVKVAKADKKAEVKETKKVKVAKADKKAEVKEPKKAKKVKAKKSKVAYLAPKKKKK